MAYSLLSEAVLKKDVFYGPRVLPLPFHLLVILNPLQIPAIYKLIEALFLLASSSYFLNRITNNSISTWPSLLAVAAFLTCRIPCYSAYSSNASYFGDFLFFLFVYFITKRRILACAIILGLALSTEIHMAVLFIPLITTASNDAFNFMINSNNTKAQIIKKLTSIVFTLALVPAGIFIAIVLADLKLRNAHGPFACPYTLEFQAGLRGFTAQKAYNPLLDKEERPVDEKRTDLYVMDRSIVTIINKKHKSYLKNGNKNAVSWEFEIQKIHDIDFSDEEPRFIKNGDNIKLKSMGTNTFLGLKEEKTKDNKFREAVFKIFENTEDFWTVECNNELVSRKEPFQLIHTDTGIPLCCTREGSQMAVYGSLYSEKSSRLFYIVNNTNHEYYKETFENEKCREKISSFKALSWLKLLMEYLGHLKDSFTKSPEDKRMFYSFSALLVSLAFSFMFEICFFINHVCSYKSQKFIVITEEACLFSTIFIISIFSIAIFGQNWDFLYRSSLAFNISCYYLLFCRNVHRTALYKKKYAQ